MKRQDSLFVFCFSVAFMTVVWLLGVYAILHYTPSWNSHWLDQATTYVLLILNWFFTMLGFSLINSIFGDPS